MKGLESRSPSAVQICACRAIYALTPKAGPSVLQPLLHSLYEREHLTVCTPSMECNMTSLMS